MKIEVLFDRVLEMCKEVDDPRRFSALIEIAKLLDSAGKIDKVLEILNEIESPQLPPGVLLRVGKVSARVGEVDRALRCVHNALDTIYEDLESARAIKNSAKKSRALLDIIGMLVGTTEILISVGKVDKALEILDEALELSEEITHPPKKANALLKISKALINAATSLEDTKLIDRSLEVVKKIDNERRRSRAMSEVLMEIDHAVETLASEGKLDSAVKFAEKIEGTWERSYALLRIVELLTSEVKTLQDTGNIERSLEIIEKIEDPERKVFAIAIAVKSLTGLAETLVKTNEGVRIINQTLETLGKVSTLPKSDDPLEIVKALTDIVWVLVRRGKIDEIERALVILDDELKFVEKMYNSGVFRAGALEKVRKALEEITKTFVEMGFVSKVDEVVGLIEKTKWGRDLTLFHNLMLFYIIKAMCDASKGLNANRCSEIVIDVIDKNLAMAEKLDWYWLDALKLTAEVSCRVDRVDKVLEFIEGIGDTSKRLEAYLAVAEVLAGENRIDDAGEIIVKALAMVEKTTGFKKSDFLVRVTRTLCQLYRTQEAH
jgi:tetratricopeptide (TPR) repeat protein